MDEIELMRAGWIADIRRLKAVTAALTEVLAAAGEAADPGDAFALAAAGRRLATRLAESPTGPGQPP